MIAGSLRDCRREVRLVAPDRPVLGHDRGGYGGRLCVACPAGRMAKRHDPCLDRVAHCRSGTVDWFGPALAPRRLGLAMVGQPFDLAPWAALTIRGLPPSLLILWYAFRTIPPAILDATEMDGTGTAARFWRIALPSRISAVLLAWLVAFAVAMGNLAASILVVPPGITTLSIHLFGLLHYGVQDKVAGACLALLAVFATIAAGILGLVSRSNREGSSRNDRPAEL